MLETAKKLLKKIEEAGYEAYIVGGFVRDYLLGIESNDIDICTSATPKHIREIFVTACLPYEEYGSVTLMMRNVRFEITTFRREYAYFNNRKPIEIEYITSLKEDLLRRDFLINTICMDSDGNILDLLNGRADLEKKQIQTVGNSNEKFHQDSLRILRAIRFATSLNFTLTEEVKASIKENKHLLKTLSYQRKKQELEKIFLSSNVKKGVSLLIELGIDIELDIPKLGSVTSFTDIICVWASLDVLDIYPFTSNERNLISKINEVMNLDLFDPFVLYNYKLYVCSVVASFKGFDKAELTLRYAELPIHMRKDIMITSREIAGLLKREMGAYLKVIYLDLEEKILKLELSNNYEDLAKYIIETYSSHTF
ncbi:MAG: hypothetical protein RR406_02870 [Bacilli bacterium]